MRGWIFDLDGTLVDSLPGIALSLNGALSDHGMPEHPEATVKTFIGDGAKMLVTRALAASNPLLLSQVLERFHARYAEGWKTGTIPYPGVIETLHILQDRGDKVAVLSNKPHSFTIEIAEQLFGSLVDVALGQSESVPHKPDPRGIHLILSRWQMANECVCMVGDSVMDLQAARAAGIKSVAVSWGYHTSKRLLSESPDAMIHSMSDLPALVYN